MDLNELLIFAKVVEAGSFTAAARALEMPKSTVSRKLSDLEERLGARLVQRTTRSLSLTDVGRTYYEHCARISLEVEDAERVVSNLQETPRGLLRVTIPLNAAFLGPLLAEFVKLYPEVKLEVVGAERVVSLVEERFDVGIRAGLLNDSSLIAKKLGSIQRCLMASAEYLDRRGRPTSPSDLDKHDCLLFGVGAAPALWHLENGTKSQEISVPARMVVNDIDILHAAVRAGLGIVMLPMTRCEEDLTTGRLERVLPDWAAPEIPLHAVYPSSRYLSPALRVFLDHLQESLPTWKPRACDG